MVSVTRGSTAPGPANGTSNLRIRFATLRARPELETGSDHWQPAHIPLHSFPSRVTKLAPPHPSP